MKKNLLFFTEASNEIGFGHLSRCLALSHKLKKYFNISFYSKSNISKNIPKFFKTVKLKDVQNKIDFDCIIIDIKSLNKSNIQLINKLKIKKKINISDKENKKLKALLTIIPYENNFRKNTKSKILSGIQALILNQKLIKRSKKYLNPNKRKLFKISICLGGSDPKNFTKKIVKHLVNPIFLKIRFNIIIGSFYKKKFENELKTIIKNKKNFSIYRNPKNLFSIFHKSDFAIINSGNVKYEFAALGIPFFLFANDTKSKTFCNLFKKKFKFFHNKDFSLPKKSDLHSIITYIIGQNHILKYYGKFNRKKINLNSIDNVVKHINNTII